MDLVLFPSNVWILIKESIPRSLKIIKAKDCLVETENSMYFFATTFHYLEFIRNNSRGGFRKRKRREKEYHIQFYDQFDKELLVSILIPSSLINISFFRIKADGKTNLNVLNDNSTHQGFRRLPYHNPNIHVYSMQINKAFDFSDIEDIRFVFLDK
jgi:hypothetical protein